MLSDSTQRYWHKINRHTNKTSLSVTHQCQNNQIDDITEHEDDCSIGWLFLEGNITDGIPHQVKGRIKGYDNYKPTDKAV